MQLSLQNGNKLQNVATGSTGVPDKIKVQIATNPHIYKKRGKKPTKYAYAFKIINCKRDTRPSQKNIYLNKSSARRIYTRMIVIRKRVITTKHIIITIIIIITICIQTSTPIKLTLA